MPANLDSNSMTHCLPSMSAYTVILKKDGHFICIKIWAALYYDDEYVGELDWLEFWIVLPVSLYLNTEK